MLKVFNENWRLFFLVSIGLTPILTLKCIDFIQYGKIFNSYTFNFSFGLLAILVICFIFIKLLDGIFNIIVKKERSFLIDNNKLSLTKGFKAKQLYKLNSKKIMHYRVIAVSCVVLAFAGLIFQNYLIVCIFCINSILYTSFVTLMKPNHYIFVTNQRLCFYDIKMAVCFYVRTNVIHKLEVQYPYFKINGYSANFNFVFDSNENISFNISKSRFSFHDLNFFLQNIKQLNYNISNSEPFICLKKIQLRMLKDQKIFTIKYLNLISPKLFKKRSRFIINSVEIFVVFLNLFNFYIMFN